MSWNQDKNRARPVNARASLGHKQQAGATLLEVLVAVLILSIGMLGVAAMQTVSLRNTQSAFDRTQATVMSYTILDAIRSNPGGNYSGGPHCAAATGGGGGASLVANDIAAWVEALGQTLGDSACGTIQCVSRVCTITVKWDDSRATDGGSDDGVVGRSDQTITTTSRI